MKENHLQKEFSKFGKILEISIPIKPENNLNRGFAFIEYENKESALKAIEKLHNNHWKGRLLALELSVPKGSYEAKIEHIVKNTKLSKDDAILPKNLRDVKKETL